MRSTLYIFFITLSLVQATYGQEIDFGAYGSSTYTITLTIGTGGANGDLDFGQVMTNSGVHSIAIGDANALAINITGVEYLDVFVDITTSYSNQLILNEDVANIDNPTKSIPFTLGAAYSNVGDGTNSPAQSTEIQLSSGSGSARFPILKQRFTPPGPPPPPPSGAFNQSAVEDIAVLYLYGSINVGAVDAGLYSGEVTIDVTYELPP